VYIGKTTTQINTRVRIHRQDKEDTSLDSHFNIYHYGEELFHNIEISIISESIKCKSELLQRERQIRADIRELEAVHKVDQTILINIRK
jgi:hypothetical protein